MKLLLVFIGMLISLSSFSYVDLSANFFYSKEVYGTNKNVSRSRNYYATWAWYVFKYTAIELNYSHSEDIIQSNETGTSGTLEITGSKSVVTTDSYGIGLRQALAPRSSTIIPALSFGWASQKQIGSTTYTANDAGTPVDIVIPDVNIEQKTTFAAFMLTIRLTRFFGINGMIRKYFPKDDKIEESMQYSAGINWLF